MRILVISQFFPPEMGAPAARFFDFARYWIATGHHVTVITAFPNWPTGVVPPEYRRKFYHRETIDAIDVHRGYIYTRAKLGTVGKIVGYITFMVSSLLIILLTRIEYDIVISTSPPPLMGISGILASRLRGVPLVFDVRDIWPEGIVNSGELKNRLLIRFLEWIEIAIYRCSRLVTVVTQGKRKRLAIRGVPKNKLRVIPNGIDISVFDDESRQPLPEDLATLAENSACITYAGVLNLAQGLDIVLEAAHRLREKAPELYEQISFLFIGDGAFREHLEARKIALNLDRVHFLGMRPRTQVFAMLNRSFAILVTLRPRLDLHTVPSKIYEGLASGRPILLSAAGEAAEIILRAGAGTACKPGDVEELTNAIQKYLLYPSLADTHGQSGRQYFSKFFDRTKIGERFLKNLASVVNPCSNNRKSQLWPKEHHEHSGKVSQFPRP